MTGASPFPKQKGVVRRGSASDLVPYMVEYVNHLRDVIKRAKTMDPPPNAATSAAPPISPDQFFRSQINVHPVRKRDANP